MRICILARTLNLKAGGVARVPLELSRSLMALGHPVDILTTEGSSLYSYFIKSLIPNTYFISNKADVYHSISPMESLHTPKKNSVGTFLDLMTITNPEKVGVNLDSNWKIQTARYIFRIASQQALKSKVVTAISEETKIDITKIFGYTKTRVIRLGIRKDLNPEPNRHEGLTLGYLGQLNERKRVNLLVKAFNESSIETLIIVGKGPNEESLKKDSCERVRFMGSILDSELKDFYNSIDALVFPSLIEGYGLPIVEAMACKKPVIVLLDSKIPQELKSRCLITDSLDYLLINRKYLQTRLSLIDIESNYEFAKLHSWETCAKEYLKIYEEVRK